MTPAIDPPAEPSPLDDAIASLPLGHAPLQPHVENALRELSRIDHAVYEAIASTPSPLLDEPLRRLSNAANRSVVWLFVAAVLATFGGRRGRRAAAEGLVAVAISSALVNLGLKSMYARRRPDRTGAGVVEARHVKMPSSSSFPSGHSASGFAFATAAGQVLPFLAFPLRALAALVAYSRVHTGVHYPADALVGSLAGGAVGSVVGGAVERVFRSSA